MKNINVIKHALAATLAAGALCFASTAADVATSPEPAAIAEPAPAGPAATTPFTAPRYFDPLPPRQDNPTNPPGTWEVYPSPTTRDLYCVDFVDANNGWAGGRSVALRYRNGTWSVIPGHLGHVFDDIDMLSLNDGWAVGWDGNKELPAIWRWNGSDWKEFQNPTGAVYCVDMIDNYHGWIGGNRYFLRFNGATWEWGGGSTESMLGIHMFSDTDGRSSGFHSIMRRVGNNWFVEANNNDWNLASIYMVNASKGWASGQTLQGEKGMLLEYAGSWRENSVYEGTRSIADLDIFGGDFGWAVGWLNPNPPYGALILFYDGIDWKKTKAPWENPPISVEIINRNSGWVVGYKGLILKYKPNLRIKPVSLGRIKAIYR